jgi:hypothetical protein
MNDAQPSSSSWQAVWQQAWDSAQPKLSSIRDSLGAITSPTPRIVRVGQLDSELLDQELVHLLCEPLQKALSIANVCLLLCWRQHLTSRKDSSESSIRSRIGSAHPVDALQVFNMEPWSQLWSPTAGFAIQRFKELQWLALSYV